ncbi:lactate racemase domain-containing protein [Luoshenia tenuis]|jgi:nickel-dependent lactate racemase|uniref:lactate racemase domain-containing protein n=1 Tax=Luoshenia tenuis TaxID=2763654 RepID=UPI003D8B84B8
MRVIEYGKGIDLQRLEQLVVGWLEEQQQDWKKVLLLPPDITRSHSMAGPICDILYRHLSPTCQVDLMPALGTHMAMEDEELRAMFGQNIPLDRFIVHNWQKDCVTLGKVPGEFVREVSEGLLDFEIEVQVNHRLIDGGYDKIISVGQVVPHEVVGMANYSKNIFVGCGGESMISGTHFLGAVYGMERMMGRDRTPVRKVFDYAQEHFLSHVPLTFMLTVIGQYEGEDALNALFIGSGREPFEEAVKVSQKLNLNFVKEPLKKVVVFMEPEEFRTTWVGNKSIYRTRMAIADGGELIVLAPGVRQFGESEGVDRLIGKYGYTGRDNILAAVNRGEDIASNLSVAAHIVHGSPDGRFNVTYAVRHLTKDQVESIGFTYGDYDEYAKRYDPKKLKDGFNTLPDGEEIYYISNPALGLWALEENFK